MGSRLQEKTCIWCGERAEFRCLIQRVREPSFRYSVRFELCPTHASPVIEQLGELLEGTDLYLYKHLRPKLVRGEEAKRHREGGSAPEARSLAPPPPTKRKAG